MPCQITRRIFRCMALHVSSRAWHVVMDDFSFLLVGSPQRWLRLRALRCSAAAPREARQVESHMLVVRSLLRDQILLW